MHDHTRNLFRKPSTSQVSSNCRRGVFRTVTWSSNFDGLSPEARHEVDNWIWTNLPDENKNTGELRENVVQYLVHDSSEMW